MHYYGTRLSENISRREPEGYLLCLNVPVARTGVQEYLPEELGMTGGGIGPPGLIPVQRPEEEVFAPETMASFEAMPVTNDHPPDGVDISNIRALQKGHVHNVRRGSGAESDLLLADLIITDPVLIELILGGKREISCGYTYELHEENGKYIQRKIRGNHVAVVNAGRAGARVSIRDREPATPGFGLQNTSAPGRGGRKNNTEPERRTKTMKKSLSKILARMAKDGDIETVAEIIEEMIEPEGTETSAKTVAETIAEIAPVAEAAAAAAIAAEGEKAETTNDEATMADIVSRLDRIIELLTPGPASDEDPVEEIAETVEEAIEAILAEEGSTLPEEEIAGGVMPEEVAEIMEEILEPAAGEATIEETEDEDEEEEERQKVIAAGDANRAKLRKARKKIAKMPKKQQDRAYAEIYARLRKNGLNGTDAGIYAALAGVRRKPGHGNPADLGKKIMAKRNINCRK